MTLPVYRNQKGTCHSCTCLFYLSDIFCLRLNCKGKFIFVCSCRLHAHILLTFLTTLTHRLNPVGLWQPFYQICGICNVTISARRSVLFQDVFIQEQKPDAPQTPVRQLTVTSACKPPRHTYHKTVLLFPVSDRSVSAIL